MDNLNEIKIGKSKKHIIIAGVPRAGKTTICEKLVKSLKYQHLLMDDITISFEESFACTGIIHTDCWEFRDTSKSLVKFIKGLVNAKGYDKFEYGLTFDCFHITPQDYNENIDSNRCDIYFFGYPNADIEEKVKQIKKFDTKHDWTYNKSDEFLRDRIITYIEISKWLQHECEKYDLQFIDISKNREQIIDEFVYKIINNKE